MSDCNDEARALLEGDVPSFDDGVGCAVLGCTGDASGSVDGVSGAGGGCADLDYAGDGSGSEDGICGAGNVASSEDGVGCAVLGCAGDGSGSEDGVCGADCVPNSEDGVGCAVLGCAGDGPGSEDGVYGAGDGFVYPGAVGARLEKLGTDAWSGGSISGAVHFVRVMLLRGRLLRRSQLSQVLHRFCAFARISRPCSFSLSLRPTHTQGRSCPCRRALASCRGLGSMGPDESFLSSALVRCEVEESSRLLVEGWGPTASVLRSLVAMVSVVAAVYPSAWECCALPNLSRRRHSPTHRRHRLSSALPDRTVDPAAPAARAHLRARSWLAKLGAASPSASRARLMPLTSRSSCASVS